MNPAYYANLLHHLYPVLPRGISFVMRDEKIVFPYYTDRGPDGFCCYVKLGEFGQQVRIPANTSQDAFVHKVYEAIHILQQHHARWGAAAPLIDCCYRL